MAAFSVSRSDIRVAGQTSALINKNSCSSSSSKATSASTVATSVLASSSSSSSSSTISSLSSRNVSERNRSTKRTSIFDKRCSRVSHFCQAGLSFIKAGLYFMGYIVARSTCRKKQAQNHFSSWATYFAFRGINDVTRLSHNDKSIIAITYNLPKDPEKPITQEILDQCFSEAVRSIKISNLSFSKTKLDKADWRFGVCAGSCMEFISEYHRQMVKGMSCEKLIKSAIRPLSEGIPARGVYAQYLGDSCVLIQPEKRSSSILKKFTICSLLYDNVHCAHLFYLGRKNSLLKNKSMLQSLRSFIERSNKGIYYIIFEGKLGGFSEILGGDSSSGHGLVYIKSSTDSFIFDPNLGVKRISENPPHLFIKMLKCYNTQIMNIDLICFFHTVDRPIDSSELSQKIFLPTNAKGKK